MSYAWPTTASQRLNLWEAKLQGMHLRQSQWAMPGQPAITETSSLGSDAAKNEQPTYYEHAH